MVSVVLAACTGTERTQLGSEPATGSLAPAAPQTGDAEPVVVAQALVSEILARSAPTANAPVSGRFANPIPSGSPLVFLVTGATDDWLQVLLPVRPNGTLGWVPAADVTLSQNPYRVKIDVAHHQLTVLRAGKAIVTTPVAIGNGATPTPVGSFYVTQLLKAADPTGIYGPFAFGLSGYSETLTSFNGGEGVIGIHGTNEPTSLGHDVSHGCIRVANEIITSMAAYLPLGTPVEIGR